MHGTMAYMARRDRIERRADLNILVPNAKSIVVVTLNYARETLPTHLLTDPLRGRISNYAWGLIIVLRCWSS